MALLKLIFNFYINSSIHVALAVYAFVRITELYFKLPYNENLDYFIFYGTITGYNFIKYAGVAKFYHISLTKSMRLIQIFSFFSFCLLVYHGSKLSINTLFYFIPFGLVTIVYIVPFLGGFQKNLRRISYLKIFLVAGVWSGVTSLIPLLVGKYQIGYDMILLFIQRMLFILVLILPFEIRDMTLDFKHIKTLPQKIGVKKTKKLGFILLLFSLTMEFLLTASLTNKNIFLGTCLVLLFLLMRSTKNQSKFYSSFWVESLPILWFFLLLIL
tara:strand:+ start:3481 stop:4293 length:813 start_codon:yes stop_codon:yes gene_type:complete